MWKHATKYAEEIKQTLNDECMFNEKYKYVQNMAGISSFKLDAEEDCNINMVWADDETKEITGLISMYRCDATKSLYINLLIGFGNDVQNYVFCREVKKLVLKMFDQPNIKRIEWGACEDNPVTRLYDKFFNSFSNNPKYECYKHTFHKSMMTWDGIIRNSLDYEIIEKEGYEND